MTTEQNPSKKEASLNRFLCETNHVFPGPNLSPNFNVNFLGYPDEQIHWSNHGLINQLEVLGQLFVGKVPYEHNKNSNRVKMTHFDT